MDEDDLQTMVGKTVERVEKFRDDFGNEKGFTLYFTDGSNVEVSCRSYNDGGSSVTVWPRS